MALLQPAPGQPEGYALSLKQPWAALLAHGLKVIEIRRWPTARRGRILIHAARIPDARPEAWSLVPGELQQAALQNGGIVGEAELTDCIAYRSREAFVADQVKHLNDPAWYDGSVFFGFVFAHARELAFRAYPGWMRFFAVDNTLPARTKNPRTNKDRGQDSGEKLLF